MSYSTYHRHPGYYRNFKLGALYEIYVWNRGKVIVKFIKVTRKGFNLLDIERNRCILIKKHLYSSSFGVGKDIPDDITEVPNVWVLDWVQLKEIKDVYK